MNKWEYLVVLIAVSSKGYANYQYQIWQNSERIAKFGAETRFDRRIPEYLNELGKDGWELVEIDNSLYLYYFKRPLVKRSKKKKSN